MTFLALLTKELRSRLRKERTIWLMIIYVLLLGLAGWLVVYITNMNSYGSSSSRASSSGIMLYYLLSLLQLFLIIFITPAFTATSVNGEKERQTFDLLLCSQLSGFVLAAGKLVAGLTNTLLLIAASIPLFSLIFFFGGVAPVQLLVVLLIYVVTALLIGTFGLFCSIHIRRPAISTAIVYVASLLWLVVPLILTYIGYFVRTPGTYSTSHQADMFVWSPVTAIISIDPASRGTFSLALGGMNIAHWITYVVLSLVVTGVLFAWCVVHVRPKSSRSRLAWGKKKMAKA